MRPSVESVELSSRNVKARPIPLPFTGTQPDYLLAQPSQKGSPMRRSLKLFALLLLLVIATFPNSGSMTTMSKECMVTEEEAGNPCLEGCIRGEISCTGACGYNQSCVANCKKEYDKCVAGCKPVAD